MSIWSKFTAWISGWPEGSKERILKQKVQNGSKPEDKKIRKQGNMT